eukprot:jgi/Chrzof1/6049/Cz17g03200.t1
MTLNTILFCGCCLVSTPQWCYPPPPPPPHPPPPAGHCCVITGLGAMLQTLHGVVGRVCDWAVLRGSCTLKCNQLTS